MPKITPMKAIRRFCLTCAGDSPKEVGECTDKECNLWPFRFGMSIKRYLKRKAYADRKKTHFIHNGSKGSMEVPT